MTEPKPERCPTCAAYAPFSLSGKCWADVMNGKKPDPWHDSVKPENACKWTEDSNGNWDTDCGATFMFNEAGPKGNGLHFCGYCGKPLEEVEYRETETGV